MKLQRLVLICSILCLLCQYAWSQGKADNTQGTSFPPFGELHDKAHVDFLKNKWLGLAQRYLQQTRNDYNDHDAILLFDASSNSFISLPHRITKGSRVWLVVVNVDTMHYTYQAQGSTINYGPSVLPTALGQIALAQAPTVTSLANAASEKEGGEDDMQFTNLLKAYNAFALNPIVPKLKSLINAAEIDDALHRTVDLPNSNEARRRACMVILTSWMKAYASDIQAYFEFINEQTKAKETKPSDKDSFLATKSHLDDIQKVLKFTPEPIDKERAFVPSDPSTAVSGQAIRAFQEIVDDVPMLLTGLNNQLQSESIDFNIQGAAWTTFVKPVTQKISATLMAAMTAVTTPSQDNINALVNAAKDEAKSSNQQAGDKDIVMLAGKAVTGDSKSVQNVLDAVQERSNHLQVEDSLANTMQSTITGLMQTFTATTPGQQTIASLFTDAATVANVLLDANPVGATPAMLVKPFDNVQGDDLQVTVTITPVSQQSQKSTASNTTPINTTPATTPQPGGSTGTNPGSGGGPSQKGTGGGGQQQNIGGGQGSQGANNPQSQPSGPFAPQTRTIHVDQGWEVMFSVGMAFTTLGSRNYYIAHSPIAGLNPAGTVALGTGDRYDAGGAAFIHYNYLITSHWSLGPTIGVTASGTPRFLLGLDLAYGHRDRLVLTGGLAIGSVTELNGEQLGQPPVGSTVNTVNATRSGFYLGLGYSFSLP